MSGRVGALVFKAGNRAYDEIRHSGFSEERIGTSVGASGGAKWLVLSQLDRVILERLVPKIPGPLHLRVRSASAEDYRYETVSYLHKVATRIRQASQQLVDAEDAGQPA